MRRETVPNNGASHTLPTADHLVVADAAQPVAQPAGSPSSNPDEDMRSGEPGADAGAFYGVALTGKGRIAVYIAHVNERWAPTLSLYQDLDAAGLPGDILLAAKASLGDDATVHHGDW